MLKVRLRRAAGRKAASLLAAALTIGSVATLAPSAAATTTGLNQPHVSADWRSASGSTKEASTPAAAASVGETWFSAPSGCTSYWSLGVEGVWGNFPCSTSVLRAQWPDGHLEFFGIGTNWHVYHRVKGMTSWGDMGGIASNPYQAYINGYGYPTIAVINYNASHEIWCKEWKDSTWQGWYQCGSY